MLAPRYEDVGMSGYQALLILFVFTEWQEVLNFSFPPYNPAYGARGGIVVKALRYKPAGRWFDSRWFH
jgi:hypothetical protein